MEHNTLSKTIIIAAIIAAISSCKHNAYETGDGDLSYMHADYTDITITDGRVAMMQTDNDINLIPPYGIGVSSEIPTDTMLRRLIYYTMSDVTQPIEILKLTTVEIIRPHAENAIEEIKTDPVKLTAAWMSHNRRYINMQLGLMTGNSDDDQAIQQILMVCDSIHTDGRGAVFLTLYHDQADIPEYYTQDVHISIPLTELPIDADTVSITINTYTGTVTKLFTDFKQ